MTFTVRISCQTWWWSLRERRKDTLWRLLKSGWIWRDTIAFVVKNFLSMQRITVCLMTESLEIKFAAWRCNCLMLSGDEIHWLHSTIHLCHDVKLWPCNHAGYWSQWGVSRGLIPWYPMISVAGHWYFQNRFLFLLWIRKRSIRLSGV